MKNKQRLLNKLSIVIFFIIIVFLLYIYFSNPYSLLMGVSGNSKENYYPYIRLIIAFVLSILLLFSYFKKPKNSHLLHLLWSVPVIWILLKLFFGSYNTEKLDYYLSPKISGNYTIHQYESKGWLINEIRVKSSNKVDTLYASINPTWAATKWNRAKNKENIKVYKSFITGYYYVTVNE